MCPRAANLKIFWIEIMNISGLSGPSGSRDGSSSAESRDEDLIRYWEGIAAVLQVSVKTAQRYEKEYGLPVRRKRGAKGTVIYALRSELNAWVATGRDSVAHEPGTPAPVARTSRISLLWWLAALPVAIAALTLPRIFAPREPVSWRIDQQRLSVLDSRGHLVWSRYFDFALQPGGYRPPGGSAAPLDIGQFVELDNDGHKELLFLAVGTDEYKRAFYCFNADGTVRFSVVPGHTITRTVRFGDNTFAPPFGVLRYLVVDDAPGRKAVLVISYDPTWFPAVVQKYSASGRLLGEYWNPGRLVELAVVQFGSRRYLFAGGTNNEFHAGSLAVFDWDRPWGFGPASNPRYRCKNCPPGAPLAYFVFPEMDVARVLNAWPAVWRIHQDTQDRVCAQVLQTREPLAYGGPPGLIGAAIYCFDKHLVLRSAEIVEGYRVVHGVLEAQGRLNHPVGTFEEQQLLPVLHWRGGGFEKIWPTP
jgi:hypothetical protein